MPTNYETLIESLSSVLNHRIEAQEHHRSLGLSCMSLSEFCAGNPAAKYAYLLLAEQAFDGELKELPKLSSYGYTSGETSKICPHCGKSFVASPQSCRCRDCAKQLLTVAVLREA